MPSRAFGAIIIAFTRVNGKLRPITWSRFLKLRKIAAWIKAGSHAHSLPARTSLERGGNHESPIQIRAIYR